MFNKTVFIINTLVAYCPASNYFPLINENLATYYISVEKQGHNL